MTVGFMNEIYSGHLQPFLGSFSSGLVPDFKSHEGSLEMTPCLPIMTVSCPSVIGYQVQFGKL